MSTDTLWDNVIPTEYQAQELGCTCEWWGRGSIIRFDKACPVLHLHRQPSRDEN